MREPNCYTRWGHLSVAPESERRRMETMARLSSTLRTTFAEERCELPPEFIDLLDRIDGRRG